MNERPTAADLAGHCNELTAWRILKEVSEDMLQNKTLTINPYCIAIDNEGGFSLFQTEVTPDQKGFEAPEVFNRTNTEASAVWSLAASLFFIVMGCQVMNGKGGRGQDEHSRIPYMRSKLPQLSELIQKCLHFHPECRPSLQKVHEVAVKEFQRCTEIVSRGPRFRENSTKSFEEVTDSVFAFWPEAMRPDIKTKSNDNLPVIKYTT